MAAANHSNLQLELVSDGPTTAGIAFHRPGIYGANFGLDADNWFSTQGWSAGSGYTNLRAGTIRSMSGGIQFPDGTTQTKAGIASTIINLYLTPKSVTCSCSGTGCWAWLPTGSYGTCGNVFTPINPAKKISLFKLTGMYGPKSLPADACFAKVKFFDGTESNIFDGDTLQASYPFMNIVEIRPYMTHQSCNTCSCTINIEGFEY